MTSKLQEAYEDLLLEQAMNEYMEEEGARLQEESKRLNADPTFELPEGFEERCQKAIDRAFRKKRWQAAGKTAMKMGKRVAIFVAVICVASTVAFFTVEGFRLEVLNLVMEEKESHTDLTFVPENAVEQEGNITIDAIWLPEGYEEIAMESSDAGAIAEYVNTLDNFISVFVHNAKSGQSIDTEDAATIEDVEINGYKGVCVQKGTTMGIFWVDEVRGITISIQADALTEEEIIKFSENLVIK